MTTAPEAPCFYQLLQRIIRGLLRLLTHLSVEGIGHVPPSGPLIIAPNHLHILDAPILFALIPRRLIVFAADKWRGTPIGWLLQIVANAIYVARGEPDRSALTQALAVLQAGGTLAVAPEGTRSRDGGLQPGKDGAVYLASRTGAAILPAVVWGQERALDSWLHGRRPDIHVKIAAPIKLPPETKRIKVAQLHPYTDELMLALARMLPPAYRGVYADRLD